MTARTPKPQVDTSKPHPARVYDYLLGGKDNYVVDQEVGKQLPEASRRDSRLNREFMHRAVAWVAREGIAQFLDIGTGIPTEPNLHQIVQGIAPTSRVVYTDNDPIVLRHAEALLISTAEGVTDYIEADVRRPGEILDHARGILDFSRPVALSLIALMHFIADEDDPYGITRTLVDALPSGSVLVFSQGTADFQPQSLVGRVTHTYGKGGIALRLRTHAEVLRFFDGLDLVEPGLVTAPHWYRDTPAPADEQSSFYVGVARVR
ncbi:SAM-dependent methyltransferase [Streptomyces corynorhini]|uniref:SAM-dependent methyltransferase n=1 Tax=Streptomyces corynorhini TaxID=2282652 RepID=A0A370B7P5_9ACTN|nr:SAM-dependent methyltransferase [Streptomyces corynorhini]RDG37621.1 SAM-dependent methyltransferase [Streptomyces corynorhini]